MLACLEMQTNLQVDEEQCNILTEVAGEGGTDCSPQKCLSSQQFRHLMRCTNHVNKICLPCLVPEIQLFVYIFGNSNQLLSHILHIYLYHLVMCGMLCICL